MNNEFNIGMDVHKDSLRITVLMGNVKETIYEGAHRNDIAKIVKLVKIYDAKGNIVAGGIAIPKAEDEATRDLLRCRDNMKLGLNRSKHRLSKLKLRLGYWYEHKAT